jgi:hypothetical protein
MHFFLIWIGMQNFIRLCCIFHARINSIVTHKVLCAHILFTRPKPSRWNSVFKAYQKILFSQIAALYMYQVYKLSPFKIKYYHPPH